MKTSLFIAFRYLFSRRKGNAANIISLISIIGVMVGTAGLIIVLSVFNGFSGIVMSLYDSFDPDIKITAAEGKSFTLNASDSIAIAKTEGIETVSYVLEENALLRSGDRQVIATIKGVDQEFFKVSRLNEKIIDGVPVKKDSSFAIMGAGVAYSLSITGVPDHCSVLDPTGVRRKIRCCCDSIRTGNAGRGPSGLCNRDQGCTWFRP